MPNLNNEDNKLRVSQLAQNPEITNPVSPEMAKRTTLQRFSQQARVVERCNTLSQILPDSNSIGTSHLFKLPERLVRQLNRPSQVSSQLLPECRCVSHRALIFPTPVLPYRCLRD